MPQALRAASGRSSEAAAGHAARRAMPGSAEAVGKPVPAPLPVRRGEAQQQLQVELRRGVAGLDADSVSKVGDRRVGRRDPAASRSLGEGQDPEQRPRLRGDLRIR